MKVERAEPDTEEPGNMRTGSDADSMESPDQVDAGTVRNYHDIRASLAIINGYSNALRSTFEELKEQYGNALEQSDGISEADGGDRLMSLEADCRFCLSRLCSSVDQLKQSLKAGGVLRDFSQD